jgi:hypothetical protein
MPKTARTRGEEVFEDYLVSLRRKFTYEPEIGNRRPDYLVHAACGDVLCEVKDFELNDEDRAELEAIAAGRYNAVSSREIPFNRIQLRIRAASAQLREFKGRYPLPGRTLRRVGAGPSDRLHRARSNVWQDAD